MNVQDVVTVIEGAVVVGAVVGWGATKVYLWGARTGAEEVLRAVIVKEAEYEARKRAHGVKEREGVPLVGWIAVVAQANDPDHAPKEEAEPSREMSVQEAAEAVVREQQVRVLEEMWGREAKGEV